ncbi:hypothetical protein [Alterisphingorhabdus coralli]|uniref:Uncharacterized protein n=1 Tax=Alterisphingorhabdus coralli TaxID=3071408 RepID=A0AA97HZE4_9SPHN|nr:hypothetical protein [Parasphingorhabdus sp. SCSIO 66989]WOE73757.1 hypothetical protein RB602_07715 [Parasphingorhabdus sp. SCSIO 66989]
MNLRLTPPFGESRWLSFRMHPVNWITIIVGAFVIGLALYALLYVDLHPQDYTNIPMAILVVAFANFIAVYPYCVYRIGYDDDAIYMRPPQVNWKLRPLPFVRLPFDHIGLVTGERAPINQLLHGSNRFTPFQYAAVYPHICDYGDSLLITLNYRPNLGIQ